jgi:hypothetical protein
MPKLTGASAQKIKTESRDCHHSLLRLSAAQPDFGQKKPSLGNPARAKTLREKNQITMRQFSGSYAM